MAGLKHTLLKYSLKLLPDRKLFCPLPFKYMEITTGGRTSLCCYLNKSPGIIEDNNVIDIYNSPSAQKIRASILDGTFRYCDLDLCPHFSSGDLPLQKDCTGTPFEDIVTNNITVLDKKSIWITFDRRCNLRCISCRADFVKYSESDHKTAERLLGSVKSVLSQLDQIGLCGNGDPFVSPPLRDFLYSFNASDYPQLKITLLTNGLLFTEQTWDSMKRGRGALKSIQVSIDAATKETYERIRMGGAFDKLMNNLFFMSQLRKQNLIKEFIISFVVNAINFSEMDAFVGLGIELGCDQVYFSYMGDWGSLSKKEYAELAVHLPTHPLHEEFRKKLEGNFFNNPIVLLGNVKRFKARSVLRDSLFS